MKEAKSRQQLNEGLRSGDLKEYVDQLFTVDRYRSKMGNDKDIVVLGFRVRDKYPALDLVEFIEKGYPFVLDADVSSGEENDGRYSVFVELERNSKLPKEMKELMNGIGQLCDCREWRFRYQKSPSSVEFNEETVLTHIPITPELYENKILEFKNQDLAEFFDQGATAVSLDSEGILKFSRPFAETIEAKFIAIGDYDNVKDQLPGALSLDESSQSQVLFLNKYLGNYDICKIDNKFLISKDDTAVIIEKARW